MHGCFPDKRKEKKTNKQQQQQQQQKRTHPGAFNKMLISLPRFIRHISKSDRDIIIRNITLFCRIAWRSTSSHWNSIYLLCSLKSDLYWMRLKAKSVRESEAQSACSHISIKCMLLMILYCLNVKILLYDFQ